MNFKFLTFKNILIGLAVFGVLIALLGFSGKLPFPGQKEKEHVAKLSGSLTIWGTVPKNNIDPFLKVINKDKSMGVKLSYREVSYDDFTNELTQSLADSKPPDVIFAPTDIIFSNLSRLRILPESYMKETYFKNTFIDIASLLYFPPYGYVGIPIGVDPLILYYNKDILNSNNIVEPPKNWEELAYYTKKILEKNNDNDTKLSSIALGTYNNIPNIVDIFLELVLETGVNINPNAIKDSKENIQKISTVFKFLDLFSNKKSKLYNWNHLLDSADIKFLEGNSAFYIGYASDNYIINSNQKLNIQVSALPSNKNITFGKLYSMAILKTSPGTNLAFLLFTNKQIRNAIVKYSGIVSVDKSVLKETLEAGGKIFDNITSAGALVSKNFIDTHRKPLENIIKTSIKNVYKGSMNYEDAAKYFLQKLQEYYNDN